MATAGVFSVWSLSEFSIAVAEREEGGRPAVARAVQLGHALAAPRARAAPPTGRRRSRRPSAGRSSRRRPATTSTGSPPAPEVASTSTSASPASAGRRTSTITPVEVSLCAQAIASAAGSATGSGAPPGSASTSTGSPRNGRAGGHRGELARELAVGQVQGALAHQPARRGVPEGGGAAVAEHHLVAVGQREQLGAGPPRTRPTTSLTGAWRWEVPSTDPGVGQPGDRLGADLGGAAAEAAVGRLELVGNLRHGVGHDGPLRGVGFAETLRLPRRAAVITRRSPVVSSTSRRQSRRSAHCTATARSGDQRPQPARSRHRRRS